MQEFGFLACIQKDNYYMTKLSLEYLMHLNLSYNCSNILYNFSNSKKSNYKAVGGVECLMLLQDLSPLLQEKPVKSPCTGLVNHSNRQLCLIFMELWLCIKVT